MNLPPLSRKDFLNCEACAMGKSTQSSPTSPFHRAPNLLDLVHTDIIGPIHPPTVNGKKYILTFIDDHTRLNNIFLLANKSEACEVFKQYQIKIEKQTGRSIQKLKSDRGGE